VIKAAVKSGKALDIQESNTKSEVNNEKAENTKMEITPPITPNPVKKARTEQLTTIGSPSKPDTGIRSLLEQYNLEQKKKLKQIQDKLSINEQELVNKQDSINKLEEKIELLLTTLDKTKEELLQSKNLNISLQEDVIQNRQEISKRDEKLGKLQLDLDMSKRLQLKEKEEADRIRKHLNEGQKKREYTEKKLKEEILKLDRIVEDGTAKIATKYEKLKQEQEKAEKLDQKFSDPELEIQGMKQERDSESELDQKKTKVATKKQNMVFTFKKIDIQKKKDRLKNKSEKIDQLKEFVEQKRLALMEGKSVFYQVTQKFEEMEKNKETLESFLAEKDKLDAKIRELDKSMTNESELIDEQLRNSYKETNLN